MEGSLKEKLNKLYSKWNKLQWFNKVLILLGSIGLLYYVIKEYYVLLLVITVGLIVKFLWRAVFCKGKIKNNRIEFNLSIFAETILIFWYLAFVVASCFVFYTQSMAWYAYILPFIYLCINFAKILEVLANRRDFIIISGPILTWRDGDQMGELEIKSYFFEEEETKAIEFSPYSSGKSMGPFLMVTDVRDNKHSFDLKAMNLGGHHKALKTYLEKHYSNQLNSKDEESK
jgi:hypothetical protein